MTEDEAVAHLESRVGQREVTNINPGDMEDWIGAALHRLTEKHAHGPHRADFQRSDVSLTLVGGAVAIPADMLPGYLGRITSADFDFPFELKKTRTEFSYMLCREFPLATVEGEQIFCEGTEPDTPLNGAIFATYIAIPTLTDLLPKYEDEFIDELEGVFKNRSTAPAG